MRNWIEALAGLCVPTEIDPREYGVNLVGDRPIDTSESSVYRGRDKVVKVYDGYMSHLIDWWVLVKYKSLTAAVARIANNNELLSQDFGYRLRVVPIDLIGVARGWGKLCSVSQYIPGKNLRDVGYQGGEMTVMIDRFARLNERLQRETKEPVVRIDLNNAKLSEDGQVIVVTDVCGQVAMLNPDYQRQPAVFC